VLRARLVLQIVELVQLPEQRLQAQLGGGIPVRLIREALRNASRAFVVALRPHRPRVPVGFSSLGHDTPFLPAPMGSSSKVYPLLGDRGRLMLPPPRAFAQGAARD